MEPETRPFDIDAAARSAIATRVLLERALDDLERLELAVGDELRSSVGEISLLVALALDELSTAVFIFRAAIDHDRVVSSENLARWSRAWPRLATIPAPLRLPR